MDAHVQLLPRLRVHMLREQTGMFAVVLQEVIPVAGGLFRLYRYRSPAGGTEVLVTDIVLDPRVVLVAHELAARRRVGATA